MHCTSHNLNLVFKDAMEIVTKTRQFYDTIESVYNFFGHSIVRRQKLQHVHDRSCSNPTLKTSNPTRWSGRYDAVFALKERFCDATTSLTHVILTCTKPEERDKAMAIKKQIENFDFVCMLVVQCKILQIVNIPSKAMQCKTIDLISAHILPKIAAKDCLTQNEFGSVLSKAFTIASTWGLPKKFLNKRAKKTKAYFDEISEGITLSDPKKRFGVSISSDDGYTFLPTNLSLWRNEISGDVISSFATKFSIKCFSFES